MCPNCGERGALIEVSGASATRRLVRRASAPVRASELPADRAPRHPSGLAELDELLGGGAVIPSTWIMSGPPGAGKTTLATRVATGVAASAGREALYVSAEMPARMVRDAAERAGADLSRLLVWETADLGAVERWCEGQSARPAVVVIDSMQRAEVEGERRASDASVEAAALAAVALSRTCGALVIAVAHATKEGEVMGPRSTEHDGDAVLWLTHERITVRKHRYGPVGSCAAPRFG